jgi:hypothetical protein
MFQKLVVEGVFMIANAIYHCITWVVTRESFRAHSTNARMLTLISRSIDQ